jgi:hypothetical protein|nr:hypothetical protein [Oxalobacteraceae bacterium]
MFAPGSRSALIVTAVLPKTAILPVPFTPTVTLLLAATTATLEVPLAMAVPLPLPPPEIPVRKAPLP